MRIIAPGEVAEDCLPLSTDGRGFSVDAHIDENVGRGLMKRSPPDTGKIISAADKNGRIIRWHTDTGEMAGKPLTNYFDHLGRIAFSSDGTLVAAAGTDQTIRIFPLDVDEWLRHACWIAGRNLTRTEWNEHVGAGNPYHRTCDDFP